MIYNIRYPLSTTLFSGPNVSIEEGGQIKFVKRSAIMTDY